MILTFLKYEVTFSTVNVFFIVFKIIFQYQCYDLCSTSSSEVVEETVAELSYVLYIGVIWQRGGYLGWQGKKYDYRALSVIISLALTEI